MNFTHLKRIFYFRLKIDTEKILLLALNIIQYPYPATKLTISHKKSNTAFGGVASYYKFYT